MTHKFLDVAKKVKTMAAITKTEKETIKEESKAHLQKVEVVQQVIFSIKVI